MGIVVFEALGLVVATCLYIKLSCYVDDASLEQAGSAELVEENLSKATLCFTKSLEQAGLEFSATKNFASASTGSLGNTLGRRLARLKVRRRDGCSWEQP